MQKSFFSGPGRLLIKTLMDIVIGTSILTAILSSAYLLLNIPKDLLDSISFYTGAKLVAGGMGHDLYNLDVQRNTQVMISTMKNFVLPFRNLPFVALFLSPFALFSYYTFHYLLTTLNLLLIYLCIRYLMKEFRVGKREAFFSAFSFLPIFYAILTGQLTIIILGLWILIYDSIKKGKSTFGGFCTGLLWLKFQFLLFFPLFFILARNKKEFLLSFLATSVTLFGLSFLVSGSGLFSYPLFLLSTESAEFGSSVSSQVGLTAFFWHFFRSGELYVSALILFPVALTATFFLYLFLKKKLLKKEDIFMLGGLVIVHLMPHVWDSDLSILVPTLVYMFYLWRKTQKKIYIVSYLAVLFTPYLRFASHPFMMLFADIGITLALINQRISENMTQKTVLSQKGKQQ